MRKFNYTEEAVAETCRLYPFSAVCVLRLLNGPSPESLKVALEKLKKIHPLFNSIIIYNNGHYHFKHDPGPKPIPLNSMNRESDKHWLEVTRNELNLGFEDAISPLVRVVYLRSSGKDSFSELILTFHHAIVDSVSIMEIIGQLLLFSGDIQYSGKTIDQKDVSPEIASAVPEDGSILPQSFRGIRLYLRLVPFFIRQFAEGIYYDLKSVKAKDATIPSSSENDIITLGFSAEETNALSRLSHRLSISLNGLISSTLTEAVNQYKYNKGKSLMRIIQFANLRPYLNPPVNSSEDGCFVSSMRFTVHLTPESSIDKTAAEIDAKLMNAAKRGDKFLFAVLSRFLVRKTIKKHNKRLAATALSYAGPLSLNCRYNNIRLDDIHGFITNNCLGPEITAFASIFSGRLNIDINFLTSETTREAAVNIAERIKQILMELTERL